MKKYLIFLIFCCQNILSGQSYYSNWYFGNGAGLNFNSGKITRLNNSEIYTDEGCTSISDEYGNLLFYTNGIKIWDNRHQIINTTRDLNGHKSSTQAVTVCLKPESTNEYYIFTTDEKGGNKGLCYSILKIVDTSSKEEKSKMKNDAFYTPDLLVDNLKYELTEINKSIIGPVSEKMILTFHQNQKDIWLVSHLWNSNTFVSYLITKNGITEKVESAVGSFHKNEVKIDGSEAIGSIKISPDGKKLASTTCYRENAPIELFDFDNKTGKIMFYKNINSSGKAYGIEFSPDNTKLYISYLEGPSTITQIDLSSTNSKPIQIHRKTEKEVFYGSLQLGPDNKIYAAKTSNYIDVIENPNYSGMSCNYKESSISLGNKYCVYGLPSKPIIKISSIKEAPVTSTKQNVSTSGSSSLTNKSSCNISIKDTTVKCTPSIILNAGLENVTYEWSTAEKTKSIEVKESNYYSVTVTGSDCKNSKNIYVKFDSKPTNFNYLAEFKPSAAFNNYFAYTINDVEDFYLKVFSSSGKLLFETKDPKQYWKGTDEHGKVVKPGKYKWSVDYITKCGSKKENKAGEVTVKE